MSKQEIPCTELPTAFLRNLKSSILKEHGFESNETACKITRVQAALWVSSIFKLTLENETKSIGLYLKCLPEDTTRRQQMFSDLFFKNEAMFYNVVIKAFRDFQAARLPGIQRPFLLAPRCYRAETDGENYVIIMEDLEAKGFVTLNRLSGMGIAELFLVMKELGRFHGLSFAMKKLDPERLREASQCLVEGAASPGLMDSFGRDIFTFACEDVLREAKQHFPEDTPYVAKFQRFSEDIADRFIALCYGDPNNESYNVITHGDMWVSNVMFHYSNGSSVPDEMRFLDFQQCRYTSPGTDLGRLLFVSLDKRSRSAHRHDLLRCYYDSLSDTLRQFDCNAEDSFPFSEVESQLKKCAPYTILMSLFYLPHALDEWEGSDDDITIQSNESAAIVSALQLPYYRKTAECRRRLLEIVEEAVDRGYMD